MTAIIDLTLLGILILCTWSGYKKGVLMGLGGILAIAVSIYGANLFAHVFSYDVVPALRPFAGGYVDRLLTDTDSRTMKLMGWENYNFSMEDLLQRYPERRAEFFSNCYMSLGVDAGTAEQLAQRTVDYARESDVSMKDALVQVLCESASYVCVFILGFLILIILLTVVGNLPNLSYKIPYLDGLNDLGGAVLGLITGLLFCALLVWGLKFMGLLLRNNALPDSRLGGWLLRRNLLRKYLEI